MMSPTLRDAIEHAYELFARYPLGDVEGCPCCVTEECQTEIRSAPLRELPGDALSTFIGAANLTWGTPDDFRHFLPRILELLAIDDFPLGEDLFHLQLGNNEWRTWPEEEQKAVVYFWRAWWVHLLSTEAIRLFSLGGILGAASHIDASIDPYLDAWLACDSALAATKLAHFVIWELGGHIEIPEEWRRALRAWALAPSVRAKLEQAFFDASDDDSAKELSDAIALLDSFART